MKLAAADQKLLSRQLGEVSRAIEELLLSGLTAASAATRETFEVTFREASRLRLLRLSATLRGANEEIGRFVTQQPEFSGKRLAFFLNRTWLLARGLSHAIASQNDTAWERLLGTPVTKPVERLQVVTLGVGKKMAKGSFCAFEFRLRALDGDVPPKLIWSCVFPLKPGVEIPPEGFLQMPQKQKFKAAMFLERRVIELTNVMLAEDGLGGGRVTLTDNSTVIAGEAFRDWTRFGEWSIAPLLDRLRSYEPGPFDLEVELQDEVILRDWQLTARMPEEREGQFVYPVSSSSLTFDAVVSSGVDGRALDQRLAELLGKPSQPPLFGLLHFDRCRFVLQPLALLGDDGPELMTISNEKVDQAALLKTLKF